MNYRAKLKDNFIYLLAAMMLMVGCERELSDDSVLATNPKKGEVFTDNFVSMGSDFYFPFLGAKPDVFSVDNEEGYESDASIRIDVPNANDPTGGFAGAIFRSDAGPRDLSGFDALTFRAKASQGVTIGEFGFGVDFEGDVHRVALTNTSLSTNWQKITIPIPDASKLTQERGMFWFSAGSQGTGGNAYTFWVDEVQFEKLGTVRLENPFIFDGQDVSLNVFVDQEIGTENLGAIFNLENGQNLSVSAAPSYFEFISSDSNVNSDFMFNDQDQLVTTVDNTGTSVVTAQLANQLALGSLTLNATGSFDNATDPTTPAANVTSVYSDTYTSVTGFDPGIFAGSNIGNISVQNFGGNEHLSYQSVDFVGLGWDNTIDVSSKTTMHIDIQLKSAAGSNVVIELIDFGPDDTDNGFGGSDGTAGGFNASNLLVQDDWISLDIPLSSFTLPTGGGGSGSPNLSNLGFVVFVSNNGASFLVDNIYFYN